MQMKGKKREPENDGLGLPDGGTFGKAMLCD